MKGLKDILFNSNKQDKLTEKAFTQSMVISVLGILLCIIALTSATWAWFKEDVSSVSNNIQSAYCDVTVSVKTGDALVEPIDGKYTFEANNHYIVTITASGTAKSSYCVFVIDGTQYYTEQIDTYASDNDMTFTLKFNARKENVEIITCWGTSSLQDRAFSDGLFYVDLQATAPEVKTTP